MTNECRREEAETIRWEIQTVHGVHLITKGFDSMQFKKRLMESGFGNIDIHKNNPTELFCQQTTSK
ncbi:MAG: hypothetical protein WCU80_09395 [Paludibacteraceae bacterium]